MWKFQCICQIDQTLLQFEIKYHVEQNNAIWMKKYEKAWMWKCQINQNVAIWVKKYESKGWNLRTKLRIDGNGEISVHMSNRLNVTINFEIKNHVEQNDAIWQWLKCWNLRTKLEIDQSVEISVQNGKSIKMLQFECKSMNLLKFWK